MATTTIHVPDELLRRIDEAARSDGVSRNRFVLSACRQALDRQAGAWPQGFFDGRLDADDARLIDEATRGLERFVRASRRNRGAVAV